MKKEEFCEIFGEISPYHIAEAEKERKIRKPVWIKIAGLAACLCLAILAPLTVHHLKAPSSVTEYPASSDIIVNRADHTSEKFDLDVRISHYIGRFSSEEKTEEELEEEFESAIGTDLSDFLDKLPKSMQLSSLYSVDVLSSLSGDATPSSGKADYIPHDYVFEFLTENGGTVKIAICAFEEPLRDYFFVCEHPEESEINGITAVIYGIQNSFNAQFTYEDVNYDIETENVKLDELKNLLVCITD